MKITRRMLLIIVASLGVFIIAYSLFRHFTGIGLSEAGEKYMMDIIVVAALVLFMYNRRLAKEEKKAKETAEEAEYRIVEDPAEETSPEDENLPHWERNKDT